jgi:uncharacterized membrane protein YqaE (UPF0057 family)
VQKSLARADEVNVWRAWNMQYRLQIWTLRNHWEGRVMDVVRIIASVIIPPVGVFLKRGFGMSFLLSILLTILGYFPGLIYALYVVTRD